MVSHDIGEGIVLAKIKTKGEAAVGMSIGITSLFRQNVAWFAGGCQVL